MSDVLTYNGKPFSDFQTFFDGSKAFGSPEKDYEVIEVLGRNGGLAIFNDRYKDIDLPFPCFIRTNFIQHYRDLTAYLSAQDGYLRLETSKEPNHYRMALYKGIVEPTTGSWNQYGTFTITFTCHPERWLKSGENWKEYTADDTIYNPTLQNAKPIIRVYGYGSFEIGSETLTLSEAGTNYIDIDCDIMNAYEGSTNKNSILTVTGFPVLEPGNTGIVFTDNTITKIEIQPRWYEI